MKLKGRNLFLSVCFLGATLAANAATLTGGDADKGKVKSQACAACHGPDGNSSMPAWPKLAGQHAEYTLKQLKAFKAGAKGPRHNPVMLGMVRNLSEQDMKDIAAYYSTQKGSIGTTDAKFVSRGEALYRGGDRDKGIPACAACHGPKGEGNGPAKFPKVSGQYAAYSIAQLQAYKDKTRTTGAMMKDIAAKMSSEDMEAVAHYMQGLH